MADSKRKSTGSEPDEPTLESPEKKLKGEDGTDKVDSKEEPAAVEANGDSVEPDS